MSIQHSQNGYKMSEKPSATPVEGTFKNAPQDAGPDPLEGKSVDELKAIIAGLEKEKGEQTRKINQFIMIIQSISFKLKESGLDLQLIGRNADQILEKGLPPMPNQPN